MIVIVMLIVVYIFYTISYFNQCYSLEAVIIHVDNNNNNNSVMAVDSTDEIWAFYGTNFNVGDKVELTMFTNYTDSIYDDKIIKAVKLK